MPNNFLIQGYAKRFFVVVLVIVFIGAVYIGWALLFSQDYAVSQKLLRFNYTLNNTSSELANNVRFEVALPMEIEGVQQVLSISAEDGYQLHKRENGEQSLTFVIEQLAPFSTKLITFTAVVELTDKPKDDFEESLYVNGEKYIETASAPVKGLAVQLVADTHEQTAKNSYEWLVNNVTPSSYTADSLGAQYLLEKKTGDCTEVMYAFIALARANGIPARGAKGFWIPQESSVINAADYHDWAEFYDGDKWVLVDANKKAFSTAGQNYLVVGLYNDTTSSRFTISNKNISVSFSQ